MEAAYVIAEQEVEPRKPFKVPPLVTHFLLKVLQLSQTAPSAGEKMLKHTSL